MAEETRTDLSAIKATGLPTEPVETLDETPDVATASSVSSPQIELPPMNSGRGSRSGGRNLWLGCGVLMLIILGVVLVNQPRQQVTQVPQSVAPVGGQGNTQEENKPQRQAPPEGVRPIDVTKASRNEMAIRLIAQSIELEEAINQQRAKHLSGKLRDSTAVLKESERQIQQLTQMVAKSEKIDGNPITTSKARAIAADARLTLALSLSYWLKDGSLSQAEYDSLIGEYPQAEAAILAAVQPSNAPPKIATFAGELAGLRDLIVTVRAVSREAIAERQAKEWDRKRKQIANKNSKKEKKPAKGLPQQLLPMGAALKENE